MKFLDENGLQYFWSKLKILLSNKVDKITGKGLSTEDFTSTEKTKLAGLSNYDDTSISSRVTNLENNIASMPSGKGASGTGSNAEIFNDYTNNTATEEYSHAEGCDTTASGYYSHAEGLGTTAENYACHAEGNGSTARGSQSHAEGSGTTASGNCSHTEGDNTTASGSCSHAEGSSTQAIGRYSHAEGDYSIARAGSHAEGMSTIASDEYDYETNNIVCAHAEGYSTEARSYGAHAEGCYTYAYTYDVLKPQHAQGTYNVKDTTGKYAFIIGNGTSEDARHNAFAIDWDGLIYVNGSSTGVDVSTLPTSTDVSSKLDSSTVDSSGSSGTSGWYNCRLYNGRIQYYNTNTTYSTTSSVTSGSSALLTSGGAYTALSAKANSSDLGTAASKNYTTSVTSGSSNLVTSDGVYTALQGNSFTVTKSATDCTLTYRANRIGNLVIINLKIATTSAWSINSAKVIASIPSSVTPSSFMVPGFVTIGSLPCSHGAWLNTDYKIRMNVKESIESGTNIYITFSYSL